MREAAALFIDALLGAVIILGLLSLAFMLLGLWIVVIVQVWGLFT